MSRLNYMRGSAFNDLIAGKIDIETDFPRIYRLLEAVRAREEFRPIVTQRIPYHSIIQQIVDLPEGARPSLKLPV